MIIGVPAEKRPVERRVSLIPLDVSKLIDAGFKVVVETKAGEQAFFDDQPYADAGATIIANTSELWERADVILKVAPPDETEIEGLREGSTLIGLLDPLGNPERLHELAKHHITAFALELVPRISRAQIMDVLSSQASIAGYKAVILAAGEFAKLFPLMTTAAGTMKPAKVLVLGAGVAGLQAIATAKRLGAQVRAFDIRPEVKEQVMSLGAQFVDIPIQEQTTAAGGYAKETSDATKELIQHTLAEQLADADIVITTALVPGKRAPLLVNDAMIARMKPGSIIVDLAADQGGNVEGTRRAGIVFRHRVEIIGPTNVPSSVPAHASQLYSRNITNFLLHVVKDGQLQVDFEDPIIRESCVVYDGAVRR